MSHRRASFTLALAALASCLAGCAAGPSYSGGPTDEEPHAQVVPGPDITIWRVDGADVPGRSGVALVAPGRHRLKVRVEFPIDNESATPHEMKELEGTFEAGRVYDIIRTGGEEKFGPYGAELRERRARE